MHAQQLQTYWYPIDCSAILIYCFFACVLGIRFNCLASEPQASDVNIPGTGTETFAYVFLSENVMFQLKTFEYFQTNSNSTYNELNLKKITLQSSSAHIAQCILFIVVWWVFCGIQMNEIVNSAILCKCFYFNCFVLCYCNIGIRKIFITLVLSLACIYLSALVMHSVVVHG